MAPEKEREPVKRWLDHADLDFVRWESEPRERIELWYSQTGQWLMDGAMITGLIVRCPKCKHTFSIKPYLAGEELRFRWGDLVCPSQRCNEWRVRTGNFEDLGIDIISLDQE